MKRRHPLLIALLPIVLIAAAPEGKPQDQGAGHGGQVESAVVPPYQFNMWLCRPGAESVTVSVLAWEEMEAFIEYGEGLKTAAVKLKAGEPRNIVLGGLNPDTSYNYRLIYRRSAGEAVQDALRSFHTQRKAGSKFTFVMQADSHLDNNTDVRVYQQTLANMLTDKPDFMIDLGDTTMVDKFGSFYTPLGVAIQGAALLHGQDRSQRAHFHGAGQSRRRVRRSCRHGQVVARHAPHLFPESHRWK
jgi:hypothetical protein